MLNRRHFLAFLKPDVAADLLPAVLDGLPQPMRDPTTEAAVRRTILVHRIPGIVARPTAPCAEDEGQIGFAFPFRVGRQRVRSAVRIAESRIRGFVSPWEVMELALAYDAPQHPALAAIAEIAHANGVQVGLIGSLAMQAVTALPYAREDSDIDLVVDTPDISALEDFHADLRRFAERNPWKVDCEAEFDSQYGVKLDELFSTSKNIIIKTIDNVFLAERIPFIDNLEKGEKDKVFSTGFSVSATELCPSLLSTDTYGAR